MSDGTRGLKRAMTLGALIVALAFAAVALGAVKRYHGTVAQGGTVSFKTTVKRHKTKNVKAFFFYKVTLTCEGGASLPISNRKPLKFPIPPMKVRHRRFHGSFSNTDFKTSGEVHGKFTDHYRKAHGTLRVHGRPLGAMQGKCDTGTDDWTATKQ
jgi:hypothetical protein